MLLSLAFARFHAVSKTLYSMSYILFEVAQECGSWRGIINLLMNPRA
jgi:hypothetical protein